MTDGKPRFEFFCGRRGWLEARCVEVPREKAKAASVKLGVKVRITEPNGDGPNAYWISRQAEDRLSRA